MTSGILLQGSNNIIYITNKYKGLNYVFNNKYIKNICKRK